MIFDIIKALGTSKAFSIYHGKIAKFIFICLQNKIKNIR